MHITLPMTKYNDEHKTLFDELWQQRKFIIGMALGMTILFMLIFMGLAKAEVISDTSAIKAIMGEASNQGYQGMLAVAVGIRNRGTLQGVYGLKAKHIYKEPKWVWDLARKAWQESKYNRIHSGTHWENIKAFGRPYWLKNMVLVYEYKDHKFYKPIARNR